MHVIRERQAKNGEKSYLIQVKVVGFDGVTVQKAKTWKPEYKYTAKQLTLALNRVAVEYESEVVEKYAGRQKPFASSDMLFNMYAEYYLEKMEKKLSPSSFSSLKIAYSVIIPFTAQYKLKEMKPMVIESIYNKIDGLKKEEHYIVAKDCIKTFFKERKIKKRSFCKSTGFPEPTLKDVCDQHRVSHRTADRLSCLFGMKTEELFNVTSSYTEYKSSYREIIKKVIKGTLTLAVREGIIEKNYANNIFVTSKHEDADKVKSMTVEQAKQLMETAFTLSPPKKLAIVLLLMTGVRKGELCGLDWKDIDFESKTMKISRSYEAVSGKGLILKQPKTRTSIREFEVSNLVLDVLLEYKEWYEDKKEKAKDWIGEDNIFIERNGKRLHPTTIRNWLDYATNKAGLPHFSVHSMRHTNVTLLMVSGVSPVIVASRVGHAKVSTTLNIYSDYLGSSDLEASNKINGIFTNIS